MRDGQHPIRSQNRPLAAVCTQMGAAEPRHLWRDKQLRARRGDTFLCRSGFSNRSAIPELQNYGRPRLAKRCFATDTKRECIEDD